ncbi:MAG: CpaF family protein [Pirellulaceae bacterium]|nr:CpaF family protein [Pirellulaceae bacterium]
MISAPSSNFRAKSTDWLTCPVGVDADELRFQQRKVAIHEKLIDSLNLSVIDRVSEEAFAQEVRQLAEELTATSDDLMSDTLRQRMIREVQDEVFGLGPLEILMQDSQISDILVNHPHEVYVERQGRLERTNVIFAHDQHLLRIIQRLTSQVGRRIDETSPMVDARLRDGSRINAIIPPLAVRGPSLSIRRFGRDPLTIQDLLESHTLTPAMVDFLVSAVEARVSFLISGGGGAGKTTLLNALSAFLPEDERIITIEDSIELQLKNGHVMPLETRPANTEGRGEITQRDLVRNALRMRPDRILIGEVRGAEALDMLQAMNTGHEGSLTTIHANDTREALARLEMMVAMSNTGFPVAVVRQYIAAGIRLIVHMARLKGGIRRVMRVSEIVGIANDSYVVEDIFAYEQQGISPDGIAEGRFVATGYRPQSLKRFAVAGIQLPDNLFEREER